MHKSCPFCGSKENLRWEPNDDKYGGHIICAASIKGCGTYLGWTPNEQEGWKKWNTRKEEIEDSQNSIYTVVAAHTNLVSFISAVTSMINQGWQLQGGVSVVEEKDDRMWFYQAMTRK